jgi:glutathione S-transferase
VLHHAAHLLLIAKTMPELTLVIANKNYSSWSLRPWMLMKHLGLEFREVLVRLDTPEFKDEASQYGPSGRVPVLRHGEVTVWDSLAICEYLAELTGRGWPKDREARAVGRSVCAEMHSGFPDLRMQWPMNARARNRHTAMTPGLEADVDRIDEIWMDCRRRYGASGGPWLFGEYSVADAMYAPVVLRFNTYRAQISDTSRWYIATALEDAALQEWVRAAQEEPWTNDDEEVGLARQKD